MVAENLTLRVSLDPDDAERVVVRFLKDYFRGAGMKKAVVGLSGGLDSAVSAALAAKALGPENVVAYILPSPTSSKEDVEDAKAVAKHLGIEARTVSIGKALAALEEEHPGFSKEGRGNAAARVRMIQLHEAAYREGALVLGTGNKSEVMVGYFSKFGDGGVDVQPLADLYKTQVRILAEHLGLPESVREKQPSAGLWEGQTDEGELGLSYETLDRILLGLEIRLDRELIAETLGVDRAEVDRVARMRETTQHKRRMPLAPKFGLRTPGVDWRDVTVR